MRDIHRYLHCFSNSKSSVPNSMASNRQFTIVSTPFSGTSRATSPKLFSTRNAFREVLLDHPPSFKLTVPDPKRPNSKQTFGCDGYDIRAIKARLNTSEKFSRMTMRVFSLISLRSPRVQRDCTMLITIPWILERMIGIPTPAKSDMIWQSSGRKVLISRQLLNDSKRRKRIKT